MASKKRGSRRKSKRTTSRRTTRSRTLPKPSEKSFAKYVIATRLSPYGFGHAFGIVSVIALLFYSVLVWFGGYNPSIIINQYPLAFSFENWTIIIGLIQTYVLSYIGGWIFAKIYNKVGN